MIRQFLARCIVISLLAAPLAVVSASGTANAQSGDPVITIVGGGWGHGVGMSQYGALGRAEAGHTAEEILTFYFDGTTVEDRTAELDALLGTGLRIRLSPPFNGTRPSSATATGQDGALLSVEIGSTSITDLAGSVTLTLGEVVDSVPEPDVYAWSVRNGDDELCPANSCTGTVGRVLRPAGAEILISDPVHGAHGIHDTGNVELVPQSSTGGVFVVLADVPMDEYLQGIAEVPSSWPEETLKAQTIAARSYAAAKAVTRRAANFSFDVYDSVQDQVYGGVIKESPAQTAAVAATTGQVVVYQDTIVRTFYTSSNGGYTAASEDSFVTAEPFHIAKPDPFDAALDQDGVPQNPNYRWEHTYSIDDVSRWLTDYPHADMDVGTVQSVSFSDVPPSGRIDNALVTIVGTKRTLEVRDSSDDPYGFRFYWALVLGCRATTGCDEPLTTNFLITSFFDVGVDDFFFDPVLWMVQNDLTTGVAPNEFAPDRAISRAEVATFVWRFADEPSATLPGPFVDVTAGSFYESAVAWMAGADITTGTKPDTFSPGDTVTRGQAATFLWRYAGKPLPTVLGISFTDVEDEKFYTAAVHWMVEWGITTGTSPTTFSPDDPLTRGQIATFLWRLAGAPDAFAPHIVLPSSMRP